uniref:Rho guanine nucleotide exchange factor 7-like n=1 Tax=Sinocyclocheilus grahami TaxID=75366 RepID=A0A672P3P3_SINGR
MNPEEQTVTWLITLGVLNSPKKNIADPEEFLKTSLRDGVVLCKLVERVLPGYSTEPRCEADCIANIREFLKGCRSLKVEVRSFFYKCLCMSELGSHKCNVLLMKDTPNRSCPQPSASAPSLSAPSQAVPNLKSSRSLRRQSKAVEMSENGGGGQLVVKARFNFKQNNEDELSFSKGELIHVTRQEEGGWWEGALNGKTGWFPSNYVREVKPCEKPISPKAVKGLDIPQLTKNYYNVVVQDILEHEKEFVKELQTVLGCYLRPLQASDKLSSADCSSLNGNLEDILSFQQGLCLALEECSKMSEGQQRIGGCYLNLMCQIRTLYLSYCSSHPSAVCVLTDHRSKKNILFLNMPILTIRSFDIRISKKKKKSKKCFLNRKQYIRMISEESSDIEDWSNDTQCQDLRKRKNLELQILSEPVRGWEGDSMKSLGQVVYMSQVHIQSSSNEEKEERYFMLFPNVVVMLSASPRMSGFIYQGRLPLTGTTVTKQPEDAETGHYAFEITGGTIDRTMVFCSSAQEQLEWLEHLHAYTKEGSPAKLTTMAGTSSHHLHSFGTAVANRGPLEPPKITKPWSLSCLRPAPPLKPSAALGYKEDSSKSPRPRPKFLPKRKTERKHSDDEFLLRKSTAALEEDAQILKVIEAYCTGASLHQSTTAVRKECIPQVLLPEEEKIIVEEIKSNGQTIIEEKSLVDAVYALKDEVHELKKENKRMKQCLDEEQKSRKELERVVRKLAKQKNDCSWDEGGH